jgi:putative SOS response-associated peptidase YedK
MCGRYGVTVSDEALRALSEALLAAEVALADGLGGGPWPEVRPTDVAPVLRVGADGALRLEGHRWGLRVTVPREDGAGTRETLVINARAETAARKRTFRSGLRALVPATGWTEWPAVEPPEGAGWHKGEPVGLSAPDGRVLWFAALLGADGGGGPGAEPFVILTRPPVAAIAEVHDRMPAVVDGAVARAWLAGAETPEGLLEAPVTPAPVARATGRARPRQLSLW